MRPLIFFLGGAAALSWQIVWQHHVALALGASAQAVALTVATAMVGMTVGALLCGGILKRVKKSVRPLAIYGCLELVLGLTGPIPGLAESWIAAGDASIYQGVEWLATPFTLLSLVLTIGPATMAMGATVPVIALAAREVDRPVSRYYGTNTAGAALGALAIAFVLVPGFGLKSASGFLSGMHLTLGVICLMLGWRTAFDLSGIDDSRGKPVAGKPVPQNVAWTYAFVTGLTGFILEVTWFRSLRGAWWNTTDTFAILLFCFLVALAVGAVLAPRLQRLGVELPSVLAVAAFLVIAATPLIERIDLLNVFSGNYGLRFLGRVIVGLAVMGLPVAAIGVSLPALLDRADRPRQWAVLYGWNTVGAVVGAIGAAWLLLPILGTAPTAWMAGAILALAAWWQMNSKRSRLEMTLFVVAAFAVSIWADWGSSGRRVRGASHFVSGDYEVLETIHGPDSTTSALRVGQGRVLMIDGYAAAADLESSAAGYMDAMGRLPMLLHADPRDALVICFGTGQTTHAVRDENPERLTVVDLNPAVFGLADHFGGNQSILSDPRLRVRIMDGRAWLRRSPDSYDVVTLEPMPPFFAGSNGLYSVEFYRDVESRLNPGGFISQWFPLHLLSVAHGQSIAAAFVEVFPDAILWLDPRSVGKAAVPEQGILIGRKPPAAPAGTDFWQDWPGFRREPGNSPRPLTEAEARTMVFLDALQLRRYAEGAEPVTDNNQLLSYGGDQRHRQNRGVIEAIHRILADLAEARDGG